MKWSRPIDYHGSRSYEPDAPTVGRLSLTFAWVVSIVKEKLRRAAAPSSSSTVLLHGKEHHFSVLGAKNSRGANDLDCVFPTTHTSRLRHEN